MTEEGKTVKTPEQLAKEKFEKDIEKIPAEPWFADKFSAGVSEAMTREINLNRAVAQKLQLDYEIIPDLRESLKVKIKQQQNLLEQGLKRHGLAKRPNMSWAYNTQEKCFMGKPVPPKVEVAK